MERHKMENIVDTNVRLSLGTPMCRRLWQLRRLGRPESAVHEKEEGSGGEKGVVQGDVREWRSEGLRPVQVGYLKR